MNDQSQASRALKSLRERSGLSVREVANRLGVPLSTYSSYERTFKKQFLPMELVTKLSNIFGNDGKSGILFGEVLALGMPSHQVDDSIGLIADQHLGKPQSLLAPMLEQDQIKQAGYDRHKRMIIHPAGDHITIRGVTKNERHIHFRLLEDDIGGVPRPPGIDPDAQAFAFFTPDDRMSPRWRRGELVFVQPFRPPVPGDHMLIFHKPHADQADDVYFAKYALSTYDYIAMEFYTVDAKSNGATFIGLPPSEVTSMWRVFEWSELIG